MNSRRGFLGLGIGAALAPVLPRLPVSPASAATPIHGLQIFSADGNLVFRADGFDVVDRVGTKRISIGVL